MDWENQKVIGYTATTAVELRLEDLTALGKVIDTALAGWRQRRCVKFDSTSRTGGPARDQAIRAAFDTARRDAEVLAQASESSLGRLVELSIGGHQLRRCCRGHNGLLRGGGPANHHYGARGRGYSDAFRAVGAEKPRPIGGNL